jgi:hypothetical protein
MSDGYDAAVQALQSALENQAHYAELDEAYNRLSQFAREPDSSVDQLLYRASCRLKLNRPATDNEIAVCKEVLGRYDSAFRRLAE